MMHDEQLDAAVAAVSPLTAVDAATIDMTGFDDELLATVLSAAPDVPSAGRRPRRHHARRVFASAAMIAAIGAGVATIAVGTASHPRTSVHWGAPELAVARDAPRLLVDAAGWKVTRADQFSGDNGEMTFTDGTRTLDLHWTPLTDSVDLGKDRASSSDHTEPVTVHDNPGVLYRYTGTTDYTTIWAEDDHVLEARGVFATIDEYKDVLAHLRRVDVDTWLRAMPASVVKPSERDRVVRAMMADIPLPPNFDVGVFAANTHAVSDRYQLGATVTGAIACSWIDTWIAAVDGNDANTAHTAVSAMQSSHHWKVLAEMNPDGDYPEVLWEYADAMATNGTVQGGKTLTVRDSYRKALGCNDR